MPKTSEVYRRLFHYTSEAGLNGILESQALWATNIRHLNDFRELTLFGEIGPKLIFPAVRNVYAKLSAASVKARNFISTHPGGLEEIAEHDAGGFIEAMYGATGTNFFVTSFCGEDGDEYINENGLLSQWRGYGGSQGFMIVFDTEGLESIIQKENEKFAYEIMHLSDVVYSDDEENLQAELSGAIGAIRDYTQTHLEQTISGAPESDEGAPMDAFVQCITRYKHRGFKEEHEVRIAGWARDDATQKRMEADLGAPPRPLKPINVRTRADGKNIPYIELFGAPQFTLPVQRVVVGPHADKVAVATKWREKLEAKGIEVTISDIPYV